MTAALQEVSGDKPHDYRATRGRGQRGKKGNGLASGLRRTVECWKCGVGQYQLHCPSFEAVADSKRSKWNTSRPQYSGVHVDCDRQPSTFRRLTELVPRGLTWGACLIYLDDIIIFSSAFEQHLVRLQLVLDRLRQAGLKLSPIKCHFAKTQVN